MRTKYHVFFRGRDGDHLGGHIYADVLLEHPHWIGNPTAAHNEIMVQYKDAKGPTWLCLFRKTDPKLKRTSNSQDRDEFIDTESRVQEFTPKEAADWFKRNGREIPNNSDIDVLWANARWIDKNSTVHSDDIRTRRNRIGDINARTPKGGGQLEYYLPDVERAFPNKAPALVKKFRAQFLDE